MGLIDGGETHVFSALDTATRTASVNAAADMYAKFDGPPRARPTMVPDLSAITADVLDPPQSTQRKSDMRQVVKVALRTRQPTRLCTAMSTHHLLINEAIMKLVLYQSQSEVSRNDLSEYGELEVGK
jgi:hypothetical protein